MLAGWLPDLMGEGLRAAILLHTVEVERRGVGEELDRLRPLLDRMAVTLASRTVETEIALKRGDLVRWVVALAELRHVDVVVMGAGRTNDAAASTMMRMLDASPAAVLVLGRERDPGGMGLFERPVWLADTEDEAELEAAARRLLPDVKPGKLGANGACPSGASVLVVGPAPADRHVMELVRDSHCPVLAFPAQALHSPSRQGPSATFLPSTLPDAV